MSTITLTASMRSNLASLKAIQGQMDTTQTRLSTGKKVNSAIDNASSSLCDALKVGEEVKVKVLSNKDGKISLSIKALEEAPAREPREDRPRRAKKEESIEYTEKEKASTSLADLLGNIKLD